MSLQIAKEQPVTTLVIEFATVDYPSFYELWEEDRTGRAALGVRGYRIFRPLDDEFWVILHYEVDDVETAEKVIAALRNMFEAGPLGKIIFRPEFRVCEEVEAGSYVT
jgi:hypothetical protein